MPRPRFRPNRFTAALSTTFLACLVLVAIPCGGGRSRGTDGGGPGTPDPSLEEPAPATEIGRGALGATPDAEWSSASSAAAASLGELGELVFDHAGRLIELPGGATFLHGHLVGDAGPAFRIELELTPAAAGEEGALEPARHLAPGAYVDAGGEVDPSSWRLFDAARGRLVGTGSASGGEYELTLGATPALLGTGASGRNLRMGLGATLVASLVSQPLSGALLPNELPEVVLTCDVLDALGSCVGAQPTTGLRFDGWDAAFVPVARGTFVEDGAGFGTLSLIVVEHGTSDRGFEVAVELYDPVGFGNPEHPPEGSPLLELEPAQYTAAGGAIEPGHWRYYRAARGSARGLGAYSGVEVQLTTGERASQVGFGADGRGAEHGCTCTLAVAAVSEAIPGLLPSLPVGAAELRLLLPRQCEDCPFGGCASFARTPVADEHAVLPAGVALALPGIATDLVLAAGGAWVEDPLGRVSSHGLFASASQPSLQFRYELHLGAPLDPGAPEHEASLPPRLLAPSAYADAGGPVDPDLWTLFEEADLLLVGLGDATGATLLATRAGPAAAVGAGASGASAERGARCELVFSVESQPGSGGPWPAEGGEAWLAVDLASQADSCARGSLPDAVSGVVRGRSALSLDGIGATFVFEPGVRFVELHDGRAKILGTLVDAHDDHRRFHAEVDFGGRLDPGVLGHAPEPGPQTPLPAWLYAEDGGPLDPATWSTFRDVYATLRGEGDLHGATLELSRSGPAVQLGVGANGESTEYGLFGSVSVEVLAWPGAPPNGTGAGTIQLELPVHCP